MGSFRSRLRLLNIGAGRPSRHSNPARSLLTSVLICTGALLVMLALPAHLSGASRHASVQTAIYSVASLPVRTSVEKSAITTTLPITGSPSPTLMPAAVMTVTATSTAFATELPTLFPSDTPIPAETATQPSIQASTSTLTSMPAETATFTPESPSATVTPTSTDAATPTPGAPTDPVTPNTVTPSPTNTTTSTPELATDPPAPAPVQHTHLFISEFMANPAAVSDSKGEYIEIFNGGEEIVNLADWRIEDLDGEGHTIAGELLIQPGAYLVMARNGTLSDNGGVAVNYVYSSFQLANGDDEIVLLSPAGVTVDSVTWGGGGLSIDAGVSLERSDFTIADTWIPASSPWPGSAGDRGSPGLPYRAPSPTPASTPVPTSTSVPTPVPTATETPTIAYTGTPAPTQPGPTPTASETAEPTATSTGIATDTVTHTPTPAPSATEGPTPFPPSILISEFLADPKAVGDEFGEFIELFNAGDAAVNLNGWILADLDTDNFIINVDLIIQPNQYSVLARSSDLILNGGVPTDFQFNGMKLANSEDEIVLLMPNGSEVDRIEWNSGEITSGASLERASFDGTDIWETASMQWPGSAGDAGSPGSAYVPSPPTSTPTMTPMATPMATPIPTQVSTPLGYINGHPNYSAHRCSANPTHHTHTRSAALNLHQRVSCQSEGSQR